MTNYSHTPQLRDLLVQQHITGQFYDLNFDANSEFSQSQPKYTDKDLVGETIKRLVDVHTGRLTPKVVTTSLSSSLHYTAKHILQENWPKISKIF